MKNFKKIILAGGTGQIGNALIETYISKTEEIIILTRGPERKEKNISYINWKNIEKETYVTYFKEVDVVINLVGKNVNCRYTDKNKKEIIESRVNSVKNVSRAFKNACSEPKIWIQFGSSTIYRSSEDKAMTDTSNEIGTGFSVDVCKIWEKTFNLETSEFKNTRKAILRTSMVLSKEEGVYPRIKTMAKYGLGGIQGNGKQMVSWIHEDDVTGMIQFIIEQSTLEGPFNCTAPFPIPNKLFMLELRKSLSINFGLPANKLLLEIGAFIISTETELVLKSRYVLPERILESGYVFKYPTIESAYKSLI
jgi:uncharacterized protein (TIGR01777 family)